MVKTFTHQVDDTTLLFYSTDSCFRYATVLDLIRLKKPCIIGWTETVIIDGVMTIKWFTTHSDYRQKGMGDYLLKNVIRYAKENNIKEIELDDMTDRFSQKDNIYLKNGFVYLSKGSPEMTLKL